MPALRHDQDNDAKAKKVGCRRTSRLPMVKVTELRRKERRQENGRNRLQRTTPAMTLKRIVSPQNEVRQYLNLVVALHFDLGIDLGTQPMF